MPKLTYTVQGERKTVDVADSCSIGREPPATIVLAGEAGASRRHCQILKVGGGAFELTDPGSTNGTRVNGQKIKRHVLKHGDKIQIGDTVLEWAVEGAAAASDDDILLEEPAGAPAPSASAPSSSSSGGTSEQCYLVYQGGAKDGQKLSLDKKRVTFGRNPKNTYPLEDAGTSGYHCEIVREGGAFLLRDLGSTNGTLVDGEPVTETALQHGARIRIGGTRLVFLDPTVADFEKAMSAVDDLGSEWGLLRAEMDLERVKQARRGQAVAIGALLVILGGAGYVAIAHPEILSSRPEPLREYAGNELEDFSLEDGTVTFAADPDSGAIARPADRTDGPAFQGNQFLVLTRDGRPGRGASAGSSQVIRATGPYTFGAQVRGKGGGAGLVRIVWLGSDRKREVGQSATDLVTASEWKEVRRTVVAPRDAAFARFEVVNASTGAAHFDDLFFASAQQPTANQAQDGEVTFTVTADGQASVVRAGTVLVSGAAVVAGALRPDAAEDGSRRADLVGSQNVVGGSGGAWRGEAWSPAKAQALAFDVQGKVEGGRFVTLTGTLPEDGALVIPLPGADKGIGVRSASGYTRLAEKRVVENVLGISVGDRDRFEITAPEGQSFRLGFLRVRREGDSDVWAAAIGAGTDGKLNVRMDTDAQAITKAVRDLERAAPDAEARKKLGVAIGLFRQLAGSLPQGDTGADRAAQRAEQLDREGRDRLGRLQSGRVAAIEFQDDGALAALAAEAQELAGLYEGHETGIAAQKEVDAIAAAVKQRTVVVAERRAAPFLRRAEDLAARGQAHQAEAIYRGVEGAYPGTEAANRAKAARERLPSGK